MLRVQEKIAHSLKLGGKLVFISEDEVNKNCPLVQDPQGWTGLPFLVARSPNSQLLNSMTTDKDWLVCSKQELIKLLQHNSSLQASRVIVEDKMDAAILESFQVDEVIKREELNSKVFWSEIESLFYSTESVYEVKAAFQRPCLFLDRDDVVIKDVPYAKDSDKVELLAGVSDLINRAHHQGYWVALVTNQSGLGRGWIDWTEYQSVHQKMLKLLVDENAYFDDYQFSSYIGDSDLAYGDLLPSLRKPRSGMFHRVQEKLKINIQSSVMVGDSATDLIAAFAFGIRKLYLLKSHKSDKQIELLKSYKESHGSFMYEVIEDFKKVSL